MKNDPNRAAVEGLSAKSPPTREEVLLAYRQWLYMEGRLLGVELFPECGSAAPEFVPLNTFASSFHLGDCENWRSNNPPSSRAELILRLVGAIPVEAELETAR